MLGSTVVLFTRQSSVTSGTFLHWDVAALVVVAAVACLLLVLLVTIHLVLCSLVCRQAALVVNNGSCMLRAGFAVDETARAVFPSLASGPDARHHGRYEPEDSFVAKLWVYPQLQFITGR